MQDLVLDGSYAVEHSRGRVIRCPRPEGGAERTDVFRFEYHRCKGAAELGALREDPDIDLLLFPIGLAGWEMPVGVAFEVPSAGPCGACGKVLKLWAVWEAPTFFFL